MASDRCDPRDVALKSYFLGPQAENAPWVREQVLNLFDRWFEWRRSVYPDDGSAISTADQATPEFLASRERFRAALDELMTRFEKEVPKFSPRYIGHMFSEFSLPGLFGQIVALLHNPNNISEESARVGVEIENEAVAALARMVGYPEGATGHFTSGGTLANFEAIVRARNLLVADDPTALARAVLLVPENKHYSWIKGAALIGLPPDGLRKVALDSDARLSMTDLKRKLEQSRTEGRPILMVVSVAGSTELGTFDPIEEVQALLDQECAASGKRIWHHVDGAYGGFFLTLGRESPLLTEATSRALSAIAKADSVTLDPHKLGYVPYACGSFLVRDRRDYILHSFGAPYVQFDRIRDRGLFTLEGSRSATGAAATWMISRTSGLDPEGYGRILTRTLLARRELEEKLARSGLPLRMIPSNDSNIICFHVALENQPLSVSNAWTQALIGNFSPRENGEFFLSMTRLSWSSYGDFLDSYIRGWNADKDAGDVVLARMCLMNPFFNSVEMNVYFPDRLIEALRARIRT